MFASTVMWLPFLVFWAVVQILKPLLHCQNGPVAIRISGLSLHLSTTSLNSLPPFLLRGVPQITRERKGGTVRRLSWIWDAGAVAAVGGMAVAQGVLLWAAVKGGTALWASLATSEATSYAMNLAKRAEIPLDSTSFSTGSAPPSDGLLLRPLIPGITTPLSTLPMLLLALFVSQAWHELGHALAAASEHIPLLSTGIHLYLFLPTLYVSLPASAPATSQSPFTDLRVASAGVWHNLGMAGAVWMLSDEGGGVSRWMLEKGAMDGVDSGVTVVEVDEHSPLHSHLPPNSLITHLNDLELDSSDSPLALWRSYLSRPSRGTSVEDYTNLGWCLPSSSFSASPDLPNSNCCASTPVNSASHSLCFEAASPSSSEPFFACLDPVPFFPPSETIPRRCLDQSSCLNAGDETVCVRPASKEQVLRIGVAADDTDGDGRRTVIWQGDSQDVLRQVSVTDLLSRWWFVPLGWDLALERFYSAVFSLSLALAFFNLLPLPHLDGSHILSSFLRCVSDPSLPTSRRGPSPAGGFRMVIDRLGPVALAKRWADRPERVEKALRRWTVAVGVAVLSATLVVELVQLWR